MAFSRSRRLHCLAACACLFALFLLLTAFLKGPYSEARSRLAEALVSLPPETGMVVGGFLPAGATEAKPASREERDGAIKHVRDRDLETAPGDISIAGLWQRDVSEVLSDLENETGLYPDNADLWSDLSAVYLLRYSRAKERKDSLDLWRALRAADLALGLAPNHREARFNLARALDELHLGAAASEEWGRVLAEGLPPAWRRLADQRRAAAEQLRRSLDARSAFLGLREALRQGSTPRQEDVGRAFPFLRSELERALPAILLAKWDKLETPEWDTYLEPFRKLAHRVRVASTDGYAEECLQSVPAALRGAAPRERETWKRALGDLWEGSQALEGRRYEEAEGRLQAASRTLAAFGSPLQRSAAVRLEDALQYQHKDLDQVAGRLAGVRSALAGHPFPGLSARAAWVEATTRANAGDFGRALERTRESSGAFARLGEPQNEAAVRSLQAELYLVLGRPEDTLREGARVFDAVRSTGNLRPLHNGLGIAMLSARTMGWGALADRLSGVDLTELEARAAVLGESQELAEPMAEILVLQARGLVEALQTREDAGPSPALADSAARQAQEAGRFLQKAEPWLDRLGPSSKLKEELERDVAKACAGLRLIDPTGGEPAVLRLCSQAVPAPLSEAAALRPFELEVSAAQARREGRPSQALELATGAVAEILRQSENPPGALGRSAFLSGHRRRLDRLVDWLIEGGESERALGWLLAAFEAEASGHGVRSAQEALAGRLRLAPGEGEGILVLHALPDRVAGWLVRRERSVPFSWARKRADLPALERKLRYELLLDQGTASPTLRELSTHLLAPVAGPLRGLRSLVIVPSPELRSLPFAALVVEPAPPVYLAQRLEVSVALPAEARAGRRPQISISQDSPALFVGNPRSSEGEGDALSTLPELPGAEQEAREGAGGFPRALPLLLRSEATLQAVRRSLGNAALAQLATHAAWTPQGSALVLAAPPARPGLADRSQLLGADEVSLLDLSRSAVIVLAACRSARPGSPSANAQGLIEPLLRAGAQTVVASPWPVADRLSPYFWPPFYAELRKGGSPAAALQQAQLHCLRLNKPNLANPAFWAGFAVYHGNLPLKGE